MTDSQNATWPGRPYTYASVALISALSFFAIGRYVLANGHPHEDAYILFIYSEALAKYGRISYYVGGPTAEGATDFLWMLAIAGLNFLKIPSAQAALILNSFGIGLLATVILVGVTRVGGNRLIGIIAALALPLFGFVYAGYGGFSTPLYVALTVLCVAILSHCTGTGILTVPLLAIVLGLFRPDGVVLGAAFTVLGAYYCPIDLRSKYFRAVSVAFSIGCLYFAWRWWYFGNFLPLPLIVKSEGDGIFKGLTPNVIWLREDLILILGSLLILSFRKSQRNRYALVILSSFSLFLFLLFGVQTQNINFRFQGPISGTLLYFSILGLSYYVIHSRRTIVKVAIASAFFTPSLLPEASKLPRLIAYLTNDDYINFFPAQLCKATQKSNPLIALTEAGRIAYWLPGRYVDLVGLNTSHTAHNGADAKYINEIRPDLIFIHVAGTAKFQCDSSYCQVPADELSEATEKALTSEAPNDRVVQAPLAVYEHLAQNPDAYDVMTVRYGGGYNHLYAIKRDGSIDLEVFVDALDQSFSKTGQSSYLDLIADPSCTH